MMVLLLELIDEIERMKKIDTFGNFIYDILVIKIKEVMSKHACQSLKEAGY